MRFLSIGAVVIVVVVLAFMRLHYMNWQTPGANVLTWDAFGYYLYLPGKFIYHDLTKLEWLPGILERYRPTGELYQTIPLPNGNFAMKYLMGLSILYAPFFFFGHWAAGWLGYAQDGFSTPYPVAICFGAWVYSLAGLLLLRKVLLRFFSETTAAATLLLVGLATNYPQYVSVDSAMTHGFLFALYSLALYVIVRWHERPSLPLSFFLGFIIGLSCITRPTEGVLLLLALLWMMGDKMKWAFFRQNPAHLAWAIAGGFLGILPQLLYWKAVTGNWIFDVGAKFLFFRPHWQVLFGWEKGWFIYTPVAILMITGLFFMRPYPFRRAVLTFVLLNIWIVIAWSDWRYGASYSCRALVQSYPVMALPLAIIVQKLMAGRLKFMTLAGFAFLMYLNLFQISQYNHKSILHYNDMNRRYYRAIFLNSNPTSLDMSLLDTDEIIDDESSFKVKNIFKTDSTYLIHKEKQVKAVVFEKPLRALEGYQTGKEQWLHVAAQVKSAWGAFDTWLLTELTLGERRKRTACRMEHGACQQENWCPIEYYFRLTPEFEQGSLTIFAETKSVQDIYIQGVTVRLLERK